MGEIAIELRFRVYWYTKTAASQYHIVNQSRKYAFLKVY